MRAMALVSLVVLSACAGGVAERHDAAQRQAGQAEACVAASCEEHHAVGFASLDLLHQMYLVITFPFWSTGN